MELQTYLSSAAGPTLLGRVVVVANHARDLPGAILVLPQMDELAFTHPDLGLVPRMMKVVNTGFERAVSFHMKSLHADEFARGLAADVFLQAVGQRRLAERDTSLIMVKLHIVNEEGFKLAKITPVVGVKQRGIKRRDRFIQLLLIRDLVQRQDVLRFGAAEGECQDKDNNKHRGKKADDSGSCNHVHRGLSL